MHIHLILFQKFWIWYFYHRMCEIYRIQSQNDNISEFYISTKKKKLEIYWLSYQIYDFEVLMAPT